MVGNSEVIAQVPINAVTGQVLKGIRRFGCSCLLRCFKS
jgi:hypothetical protein